MDKWAEKAYDRVRKINAMNASLYRFAVVLIKMKMKGNSVYSDPDRRMDEIVTNLQSNSGMDLIHNLCGKHSGLS